MTNEQKTWLDDHKAEGYRVRGRAAGNAAWLKSGMLHADGTFELVGRGARPNVRPGSFEVGILQTSEGQLPNPGFNSGF